MRRAIVIVLFMYSAPPPPGSTGAVFYSPIPTVAAEISSDASVRRYSPQSDVREILVQEFRTGDSPLLFHLTIPDNAKANQIIQVDLGGREFNVKIPDYVQQGEKVVVVAPAPR